MSKIKTYEEACQALNISTDVPDFTGVPENELPAYIAFYKLRIIAKALNQGWEPDYENTDQYKYEPWFWVRGGFAFRDFAYSITNTYVGSRLCFKSAELAEYAGETFTDLYKDYLTA